MADGKVFEAEKPLDAAESLARQLTASGYLDPSCGLFHPLDAIQRIESQARDQLGEGGGGEN